MIMHVLQEISGSYNIIIIYMYTYHVKHCRNHMVLNQLNQNRHGNEHVSLMSGELKKKKGLLHLNHQGQNQGCTLLFMYNCNIP